jgi:hypothetical protein
MADKLQKFAIPLGIAAAVITIWVALRKGGQGAPGVVNAGQGSASGGTIFPQVPLLTPTLIEPDPNSNAGSDAHQGAYGALDPGYVRAGFGSPQNQRPIGRPNTLNGTGMQGTPAYLSDYFRGAPMGYTSNLPPWKNQRIRAIAATQGDAGSCAPSKAGCGCGGSCGGGSSASGGCPTPRPCNGLIDGAGVGFQPVCAAPTVSASNFVNGVYYSMEQQLTPTPSPASYGAGFGFHGSVIGVH